MICYSHLLVLQIDKYLIDDLLRVWSLTISQKIDYFLTFFFCLFCLYLNLIKFEKAVFIVIRILFSNEVLDTGLPSFLWQPGQFGTFLEPKL